MKRIAKDLINEAELEFKIPWPTSVNKMYVRNPNQKINKKRDRFLSPEAREYKKMLAQLFFYTSKGIRYGDHDVLVDISTHAPDNKTRDTDNGLKIVFDSLQKSTLITNDKQIVCFSVRKGANFNPGFWIVRIRPYISGEDDVMIDMIDEKVETLNQRSLS